MTGKMKWTKQCRMGIEDIDSQHRLLFAIANEMMDFDNPEDEAPEFKYLFNHLRNYVDDHFAFEEEFMAKIQYPDAGAHKQMHADIVAEINATLTSSRDLNELKRKVDQLLQRWIKHHILVEDQKYAQWYASHHPHKV